MRCSNSSNISGTDRFLKWPESTPEWDCLAFLLKIPVSRLRTRSFFTDPTHHRPLINCWPRRYCAPTNNFFFYFFLCLCAFVPAAFLFSPSIIYIFLWTQKGGTGFFQQFQRRVFEFQQQLEHALHSLSTRNGLHLAKPSSILTLG